MATRSGIRRISFVFLCLLPLLTIPLVGLRALRTAGVYQVVGAIVFTALTVAAWFLGVRAIISKSNAVRGLVVSGVLLLTPFALFALLWVGLGPPWLASPTENRLRYLVLLIGAIAVASGFVILKEVVADAGERFYSALGFAANIMAGAAYLVWTSFALGVHVVRLRGGELSPAIVAMSGVNDTLVFVACVMTYLTTAAFATALRRIRWIGRRATFLLIAAAFVALTFLVIRGLSFPDPTATSTPWYFQPGFIAGIPAVPWILPSLLGVMLIRHAGDNVAMEREV